jgi:2-polyprenyl-3-methyl-5-hydroxy-6-metoxy-1,4-benzoquinol methylase
MVEDVDSDLEALYSLEPHPWQARRLTYVRDDATFYARMLNYELGCYGEPLLPLSDLRIWVAGCGINQAITTALNHPDSEVLGTDLSAVCVDIAGSSARSLLLDNVTLRHESLNEATYTKDFDYIVCTGVIHHAPNPGAALARLAAALRPSGVLQLMVYNEYHRLAVSPFQQALSILRPHDEPEGSQLEAEIATHLLQVSGRQGLLGQYAATWWLYGDAAVGRRLANRVEHGFTVQTLAEAARRCGLRVVTPSSNMVLQVPAEDGWELDIPDPEIRDRYERLPDVTRWHLTNLIKCERSPWLWFHLQRDDAPRPAPMFGEAVRAFLSTVFRVNDAEQQVLVLGEDGEYRLGPGSLPLAVGRPYEPVRDLYELVDGRKKMADIFAARGREPTLAAVARARHGLVTAQCPYLVPAG